MEISEPIRKYYVYEHRRAGSTNPFYVGKGCGKRAYDSTRRNPYWQRIAAKGYEAVIVKDGLTEQEAFGLEIGLILMGKLSGCCETNMSTGGDGVKVFASAGGAIRLLWLTKDVLGREAETRNSLKMFAQKRC